MPTGKGFRYTENSDAEDDYIFFSSTETINDFLIRKQFRMSFMPPPITCYHQAAASRVADFNIVTEDITIRV